MCTCRLMSSRAPNAPPTPPSTSRTCSSGRPRQAAICLRSSCSHCVATCSSTPPPPWSGMASAASSPRNAWSCMPISYVPSTTTSPVDVGVAAHDALVAQHVAVGVDRRVRAGDRRLGVEQRLEHLVRRRRSRRAPAGTSRGGRRRRRRPARRRSARRRRRTPAGRRRSARRSAGPGTSSAVMTASTPGDLPRRRRRRCATMRAYGCGERSVAPHSGAVDRQVGRERERALHLGDAVGPRRRVADPAGAGAGAGDRRWRVTRGRRSRATATCWTAAMIRP